MACIQKNTEFLILPPGKHIIKFILFMFLFLSGCAESDPVKISEDFIPAIDPAGDHIELHARMCRPANTRGPLPLMLFVHGYTTSTYGRSRQKLQLCNSSWIRWFLDHGYEAVSFLKSGYGNSGGVAADPHLTDSHTGLTDFWSMTSNAAAQIAVVLDYYTKHSNIDRSRVLLIGHSGGGPEVLRFRNIEKDMTVRKVVLSPGMGSTISTSFDQTYHLMDKTSLLYAFCRLGRINESEVLWLNVDDDDHFLVEDENDMIHSFRSCGGKAQVRRLPFVTGMWAHSMYFQPRAIKYWGPPVLSFALASPKGEETVQTPTSH
ncbi:alpha/beta hydrolase family protein [Acidomonas methanolica]|uniref:alpha/beta hydrolase family protein n=1 Tax=Acidomonas methanolica TaxID=437 RepID=UPI001046B57B|nr:CocE/NonD family hydrolase [Acidomonas methanolica]MBU2654920.1 hypothetical protein [Acidomonas methanolica]TCS26271.1 X-Pro dipeptidyl-peptidase-like protein [Acidomonas methanolica]